MNGSSVRYDTKVFPLVENIPKVSRSVYNHSKQSKASKYPEINSANVSFLVGKNITGYFKTSDPLFIFNEILGLENPKSYLFGWQSCIT